MKNQQPKFKSSEIVLFVIIMMITCAAGTLMLSLDGTIVDAIARLQIG